MVRLRSMIDQLAIRSSVVIHFYLFSLDMQQVGWRMHAVSALHFTTEFQVGPDGRELATWV